MLYKYISILLPLLCTHAWGVTLVIDPATTTGTISPYLIGAHTISYAENDDAYVDGSFATWCRDTGVSTMRFPGGTVVKWWDWENSNGVNWGDPWDPSWEPSVAPSNQWMSLDEYLDFCDVSEIKPLVGVNYVSGKKYNRVQDSIDRAARCVQYLVDRGYPGAFYYIGNEDIHLVGGINSAANLFVRHAQAMKAVDPTIKIFWNDNLATVVRMKDFLKIAGEWADGFEFHGKWPFGGEPGNQPEFGTYENWKSEVPLKDRRTNKTWRGKIADLRQGAVSAGYPDLLLANNEYGWGKSAYYDGFNKFTSGMVMIDFLQEHFISGYDMTCFWSNIRGADDGLLDSTQNYRRNPQSLGWELLAAAPGGTMMKSSTTHPQVYGFTAQQGSELLVYLLNKTDETQPLEIVFNGALPATETLPQGIAVVDTPDHWGTNEAVSVVFDASVSAYNATLPAMSYTLIRLPMPKIVNTPAWTDGIVFQANFNSAALTKSLTFPVMDAGTQIGSWSGTLPAGKGFIRGSESNNAVLVDHDGGGGFILDALLESEVPVDGLAVSFRVALRRTGLSGIDKNLYISGLDTAGETSFKVGIESVPPPTPGYVDPVAGFTLIPEAGTGGIEQIADTFIPDQLREITVYLNATNYWVCYEGGGWVSGELPFLGTASQLAKIRFSGNSNVGFWLDDVFVVCDPDRDGDGMPDHYELRYFGRPASADADMDADFDGMDNYSEFIAGTDPLDPHSYLRVAANVLSGDVCRLEWNAVSGRVYSVESTSDLQEPFVPLATNLFFPQQTYTDNLLAETNQFYRIQVGN